MFKKLFAVAVIIALFVPCATFAESRHELQADGDAEHVHLRELKKIVLGIPKEDEVPFCGRFYCSECSKYYYDSITSSDLGMPIVDIKGSLDGVSKTNKVEVKIDYFSEEQSFESYATFKVQGASSSGYPKKNYSIQLLKSDGKKNKVKLVDEWGKQHKYCLKANYVDYSQARNVVSGQLFNQIVHSREIDDDLSKLANGGVVDGYPVAVYYNEKFLGLYTMNIPKDKWMFGMDDEKIKQTLLFGDTWATSVALREPIADVNDVAKSGWEIEYCSTEDDEEVGTAWVAESMNRFIDFLMSNSGDDFTSKVSEYTDIDRVIDSMLFTYFIYAGDNTSKNIVWASYDGDRWIPSVYDMDGTWGLVWNGSVGYPSTGFVPAGGNLLWQRILENYPDRVKSRYVELRHSVLTRSNIQKLFTQFFGEINSAMWEAEKTKWPGVPSHDTNNYDQIMQWMQERLDYFDSYYGVTIEEDEGMAYRASFVTNTGIKIGVYDTEDYSIEPADSMVALSRTSDGKMTKDDGEVNFKVSVPEGYAPYVTVTPAEGFDKLNKRETTGEFNTFRITGIKQDLIVNVKLIKHTLHNVDNSSVEYLWSDDLSTCRAEGTCGVCRVSLVDEVETNSRVIKQATCTEDGLIEYSANFLKFRSDVKYKAIPMTGHKLEHTPLHKASLTAPGNVEYWKCSVCRKCYSDPDGKTEISEKDIVIPMGGMTVKTKKQSLKSGKKNIIKASKAFTVKKAIGAVKYKKTKGNKKITVSSSGKVTVKKSLKKGSYTINITVTAAGDDRYEKQTRKVKLIIVIK